MAEPMAKWKELLAIKYTLLKLLNGDWRERSIQHYCTGAACVCGGDREKCQDLIYAVLGRSIFTTLSRKVHSTSRWHTFDDAIETVCLGLCCHALLGRACERATAMLAVTENDISNPSKDDEEQSWADFANKKARSALAFFAQPEAVRDVAGAAVICEPVSHLAARLQHTDETGNGMYELLSTGIGALGQCLRHLYLLTQGPGHTGQVERPRAAHLLSSLG